MKNIVPAILLGLQVAAMAQETSRWIWDDYFGNARPGPQAAAVQERNHQQEQKHQYVPAHPARKPAVVQESVKPQPSSAALGITVWKLEPPAQADEARLLVQEGGGTDHALQLTPHRLEANEPLKKGDRVRLAIESPMPGFVYVVDQEMQADGKLGPPYLIFPTMRTRGGKNSVVAGQLLEIPAQTDLSNVFTVKPRNPEERGEKLTIILSPVSIPGLTPAEHEQQIPAEQFESWIKKWGEGSQQFELAGGKGRAWTSSEKQAGEDQSRLLTQSDPPPQTVFFFPGKAGKPVIASVDLQLQQ